jgi:two-component system, NarL family, nitrate/nitrite response regulator NarL
MIRALIAADIRLYREGLAQLLSREEGITVVGAVSADRDALPQLQALAPDVIILEVASTGKLVTVRDFSVLVPRSAVVALGLPDSEADIIACAEMGAAAYVTREASLDELVVAVRSAACGELICSPRTAGTLVRRLAALSAARPSDPSSARVTLRECEIGLLIHEGLSNKEIAVRLSIEAATVKNHVHNLLKKLNVHHRADAARMITDAARRGHLAMAEAKLPDPRAVRATAAVTLSFPR